MAGFIEAMRATLTEFSGEQRRTPPALPSTLPPSVLPVVSAGVHQLISYQGPDYAQLYLDRLRRFAGRKTVSEPLFAEIARLLAQRMSYLDPIALSQAALAAHGDGARADERHCLDLDELLAACPAMISEQVLEALHWVGWQHRPVTVRFRATSPFGRQRLRAQAALRRWRLLSPRYARERALTERWLHMIDRCLSKQPQAAGAVVASAELLQGCGAAYRARLAAWHLIIDGLAKPVFDGALMLPDLAGAIETARGTVSDDPQQPALRRVIAQVREQAAPAAG